MTSYDGPAFFRRRPNRKPVVKKVKTEQQNRHQIAPRRQVARPKPIVKPEVSQTSDEVPAFLKEIKNFKPRKKPKNVVRKQQIAKNYFVSQQRRQRHLYNELTQWLRLSQDELIVLADKKAPTEGSQTTSPLHISDDRLIRRASDAEEQSQKNNDHLQQKTEISPAKPSQDRSASKPSIPTQPNPKHQPSQRRNFDAHHGLGQSLATIVNKEQANPRKLALFSDDIKTQGHPAGFHKSKVPATPVTKPAVQPVTSEHQPDTQGIEQRSGYKFPSTSLLALPKDDQDDSIDTWIEHQIDVLDKTFSAFKVVAEVVDWTNGPTVTQFQVKLALGVKVSRITNLNDDLKLALAAKDIRIEAPSPGKSTVGIEIPNPHPRPVLLSEIISTDKFKHARSPLTTALGVDLAGMPRLTDIRKMPHGLIAGATGSGKSVFINSLLISLLYKATPAELKLLLIDPKAVELAPYDGIPHLLSPVISDPQSAAAALKWVTKEMDERYEKLSAGGVRNIEQFNAKAEKAGEYGLKMPYILVIIDELADLMMVASSEVEDAIVRITQKARAAGIHLIVATQRPSVDIVTGTIKNNIPSRIAFMVSSQVDSRTILDSTGAERLLGRGDMLYLGSGANTPIRLQGAFVTNQELNGVIDAVRQQGEPKYLFTPESLKQTVSDKNAHDRLMPQVMKYIAQEDTISTSKLQRVFSIGYNRAANIIDDLQTRHLVSEQQGAKPRTVYYKPSGNQASDESPDDN